MRRDYQRSDDPRAERLRYVDMALAQLSTAVTRLRMARCVVAADKACEALRSAQRVRARIALTGGAHEE